MKTWINRLLGRKNTTHDASVGQGSEGGPAGIGGSGRNAEAEAYEAFNVDDVVQRMLTNLQTKWTTRPLDGDGATDYNFIFQHGDFHVLARRGRRVVCVHYLYFREVPLGQLDNVRQACNAFNQHYADLKAIYSVQAEHNMVHIHLTSAMRLTLWSKALEEDFAELLSRCFEAARSYRSLLDDILKEDLTNLEEREALNERERYLAYEAEMETAGSAVGLHRELHPHTTASLTLADMLGVVYGEEHPGQLEFTNARIVFDDLVAEVESGIAAFVETPSPAEAGNLDVARYLLFEAEGEYYVRSRHLTFCVELLRNGVEASYIVDLRYRDEIEGAFYYRADIVQTTGQPLPGAPRGVDALNDSARCTFTLSFAPMADERKRAEFEYLWREAKDKSGRGETLTDDERFIMLSREPHVAYDLYWGLRFYLSRSYYHALLHLENAYNELHPHFHDLDKEARREFFELSYLIGICYMRLHRPKLAYYYLDGLFNLNNLRYTQAYITAIVRSHDYRAIGIVNGVLGNVQRLYDSPEEPSGVEREQLLGFLLFLRRSKAQVLIDDRRLDEAEAVLRQLLPDDKRHEAHLLEQLATVARLRAEAAAALADKDTRSVTSEFPKSESKNKE